MQKCKSFSLSPHIVYSTFRQTNVEDKVWIWGRIKHNRLHLSCIFEKKFRTWQSYFIWHNNTLLQIWTKIRQINATSTVQLYVFWNILKVYLYNTWNLVSNLKTNVMLWQNYELNFYLCVVQTWKPFAEFRSKSFACHCFILLYTFSKSCTLSMCYLKQNRMIYSMSLFPSN